MVGALNVERELPNPFGLVDGESHSCLCLPLLGYTLA